MTSENTKIQKGSMLNSVFGNWTNFCICF